MCELGWLAKRWVPRTVLYTPPHGRVGSPCSCIALWSRSTSQSSCPRLTHGLHWRSYPPRTGHCKQQPWVIFYEFKISWHWFSAQVEFFLSQRYAIERILKVWTSLEIKYLSNLGWAGQNCIRRISNTWNFNNVVLNYQIIQLCRQCSGSCFSLSRTSPSDTTM